MSLFIVFIVYHRFPVTYLYLEFLPLAEFSATAILRQPCRKNSCSPLGPLLTFARRLFVCLSQTKHREPSPCLSSSCGVTSRRSRMFSVFIKLDLAAKRGSTTHPLIYLVPRAGHPKIVVLFLGLTLICFRENDFWPYAPLSPGDASTLN